MKKREEEEVKEKKEERDDKRNCSDQQDMLNSSWKILLLFNNKIMIDSFLDTNVAFIIFTLKQDFRHNSLQLEPGILNSKSVFEIHIHLDL